MICGIDPGLGGAVAFYCELSETLIDVRSMPTFKRSGIITQDAKTEIDAGALAALIRPYAEELRCVVIERVHSSPGMGVVSAFRFGEGFGVLRGVVAALIPGLWPKYAYPNVWKAALALSKEKARSTELACKLFPAFTATFRKGAKSADLAEAALLAYYGRRFIK